MTKLEQANYYIENLQIADFFVFMKENTQSNEMLTRLERTFILGKTDVDFYEQLKALANIFFSNDASVIASSKTRLSNSQTAEKIYNIENINGDANFS